MKKTKDLKGFSIGNKDMNPYLIGVTMAASISSSATFVINPGFVYTHGLSAFLHYGVAASLGIFCAFLCLTKGFRRIGDSNGALTIPDWIRHRFGGKALPLFFAVVNLLSITFVVLILVGCSLLMTTIFPISQKMALVTTLLFVFSYVLMGGTYAHAYTNTFQGIMMAIISLFLFAHGWKYFDSGFMPSLESVSQNYAMMMNPESNLYYSFFSVFLSGFVITFALMLQPHILTKILYIKDDRDTNKFIATTIIVGVTFSLMLFLGFYAKLSGLQVERQDAVVTQYIMQEFGNGTYGPYLMVFISITMLAAGLSTLDGILVALSAMVVNDLYLPFAKDANKAQGRGLVLSRIVLVIVGLIACALAWNPPAFVGLFAQKGVYGLAAASLVPILFGVLVVGEIPRWIIGGAAVLGLGGHLALNLFLGFLNPAVSASLAIFASLFFGLVSLSIWRWRTARTGGTFGCQTVAK
jgi:SSS family solute:Na+ symporter/sodium/pantothenate symporter